jgi:hypothetical protein
MHPTPEVPSRICQECGEFLPHSCAPLVTITRQKWTGRWIVTITDRATATAGGEAA